MANQLSLLATILSIAMIGSDLYARSVPNKWIFAALCLGMILIGIDMIHGMRGSPWDYLLGMAIGFAVFVPLHVLGWMGAGDVKFFATLGFLLGAKALLPIWIIASLIAGMHSGLILISRHALTPWIPAWGNMQIRFSNSALRQRMLAARQGRKGLPYAAWLGVGALVVIAYPDLTHW